jgi:hypothetical protein
MFNPDTAPLSTYVPSFEAAARSLKIVPIIAPVHSDVEIETAIITLGRGPGGGLVVMSDIFMTAHHDRLRFYGRRVELRRRFLNSGDIDIGRDDLAPSAASRVARHFA